MTATLRNLVIAPFWQMPDGGQAVERWGMADNLAIMQQLGMMG